MVWSFPLGLCFRKTGGFTKTDTHRQVLEEGKTAPIEIQQQMQDNIQWIKGAQENKLVVGHKREFFMPMEGRVKIASAFNQAIAKGDIGTIVLGRDHHDVSGTDSPYRRHQTSTTDRVLQPIWLFKT
jgi:urocanate hydratase